MKISKLIKKIACTGAILGALAGAPQNANAADFYFYLSGKPELEVGTPIALIETVPEYVRNVPAHPDDLWWISEKDVAPIKDSSMFIAPLLFDFEGAAGVGIKDSILNFRIAPKIKVGFIKNIQGIVERNYTNAPGTDQRGYGAALTYYDFCLTGVGETYPLCFIPGLSAKITLLDKVYLEYDADFFGLSLQNGWDRYDSLEKKDSYKVADIINHTIKLGFNFVNIEQDHKGIRGGIYVGTKIPQFINKTDLANQAGLKATYPNIFGGLEFEYEYISK